MTPDQLIGKISQLEYSLVVVNSYAVGIRYLTEFSERRGIHVWIIFDKLLTKELGFRIVCEPQQRCSALDGIRGAKCGA